MLNRRHFLQAAAATALATRGAFATVPGEKRFVFIFLRGGLDGLHALAPFADPAYRRLRPNLALGADAVHGLDGYFGLPRALAPLNRLFQGGELLLVPAVATRYRSRSHFDGQNLLENGSARPFGARDGWLNRAILGLNHGDRRLGLSLGPTVPLILRGAAGIQTYAVSPLPEVDDDYLFRLEQVYRSDPLFAQAFAAARASAEPDVEGLGGAPLARQDFSLSARVAADLLSRATGPRIGVLEMQGWDTHFAQPGRLDTLLAALAGGIVALREGLGPAWRETVVMVASEFGRMAAENGSRGTDHGTGGLALLAGGAVAGGRIVGAWPGLSRTALFEGRDVAPVNAMESLFKAVLRDHLGVSERALSDVVFPGGGAERAFDGLIR